MTAGGGIKVGVGAEADQRYVVVECQKPRLPGGASLWRYIGNRFYLSQLKEIAYELPINSTVSFTTRQRSDRLGIRSTHALQKRESAVSIDEAFSMRATSEKRGKWRLWCDMNRVAYCLEVIFHRRVRQSVSGLKVLLPSRPPPPLA